MSEVVGNLKIVCSVLAEQRFAGLDQNPSGIRDLAYLALSSLEKNEKLIEASPELLSASRETIQAISEMFYVPEKVKAAFVKLIAAVEKADGK